MEKEIGGYFGLDTLKANRGEYYPGSIALNSARNALVWIVKARKIRKLYIPYLLCDSVSGVCDREGFPYEYYHTDNKLRPIFNKELAEGEYLYIVNLYGQIANEELNILKKQYCRIIVDNIHAFFQKPVNGTDTIYSCRKFFGVPDGAYLATNCVLDEELPEDVSDGRTAHIFGRMRDGASAHYAEFRKNDELFDTLPLMRMSTLTHHMLSMLDYTEIKRIRENNYAFLNAGLSSRNPLVLNMPEGPYAYPYYCKNGMKVRKALAEQKIYVATLWPNVLDLEESLEKDYAENILPLPCDQRYGITEMRRILSALENEQDADRME